MMRDLVASFLNGAFRWIGAMFGIVFVFTLIAAMGEQAAGGTIISHPTQGFEAPKWKGQDSILLLPIKEMIGAGTMTRQKVRHILQICQEGALKGKVKAILLDIDSTGGHVDDSEAIYQLVKQYSELYTVPVYAMADGFCASGAYMIACSARKIYSLPYSTIGSVGVVVQWFNISQTLEKVGVKALSVSAGEKKGVLNPFQPPMPEDEECLKPILEENYSRFISMVASARPMLTEKVLRNQVGARFYGADQAKNLGFVDEIVTDRSIVIANIAQDTGLSREYALIEINASSSWSHLFETQAKLNSVLEHVETALAPTL